MNAKRAPRSEDRGPARIDASLSGSGGRGGLTPWLAEAGEAQFDRAFDLFYRDVLAHGRVHPAQAREVLLQCRRAWTRHLDAVGRARLDRLEAHTHRMGGDMAAANRAYAAAFAAFDAAGEKVEAGRTAIGWLDVLALQGDFRRARTVADRGRRALRGRDRLASARLESNWGNALYLSGQLAEAATVFRGARRRLLAAGYERDAALISWNLGQVLLLHGQVRRARARFVEAKKVFTTRGFHSSALRCEFGLAAADLVEGEWTRASERFEDLQERFEQMGDERAAAATLWEFSRFLGAVGAESSAAKLGEIAHQKFDRLGLRRDAAHVSQLLARWLNGLGEPLEARVRLYDALDYHREARDRSSQLRVQIEVADTLVRLDRQDEALELLRKLRRAVREVADSTAEARYSACLAEVYLRRGKAGLALRHARRAYDLARAYPQKLERPDLAMICARACARRGQRDFAWRWIRRATRLVDRLQSEVAVTGLRTQASTRRRRIYRQAIDLLLEISPAHLEPKALDLIGRSLSSDLIEAILVDSMDLDRALGAAIERMREQLLAPEGGGGSDTRFRSTRRELNALEKKLSRRGRSRASRAASRILLDLQSAAHPRSWLPRLQGHPLVIFDHAPDAGPKSPSSAYVISPTGGTRRVELPDLDRALREVWSPLRMMMEAAAHMGADRREAFLARTQAEAESSMVALRRALLDPLELPPGQRTHVVAGEVLGGIPLEALAATANAEPAPILVRWPHPTMIRRTSSACRQDHRAAVILSDGRPNTRSECSEVGKLLRRASIPARRMSRQRQFVEQSRRLAALHVAAHGVYHAEEWMLNGIRLRDQWMGFEHLRPQQLQDALLYFSSCESALLSTTKRFEMNGWMVAGLRAGARSMVMTLWKIDDAGARDFARAFYTHWTAGVEVAESLARAQAEVRRSRPHPFAWAPFMAIG